VKKMSTIDKMATDGTFDNMNKKERLQIARERAKLEKLLGSISDLNRLPAALFIVDITKEHIAVAEAKKLNIPTFAIVDTNSNPGAVDFPIPANDDASKAIHVIINKMVEAIQEGLEERKYEKDKAIEEEEAEAEEAALEKSNKEAKADEYDADLLDEDKDLEAKKAKAAKKALKEDEEAKDKKNLKSPRGAAKKTATRK